jgi:tetratricopeptide (TPR) repeat protein
VKTAIIAVVAVGDRLKRTLPDLDRAIELDPGDEWFHYQLSLVHLSLGQLAQAHSYLRNAVDQARKTIALRRAPSNHGYSIAVYLAAEGIFEEAEQEFYNALASCPDRSWELEAIDDLRDPAGVRELIPQKLAN